jgi:glycosyltransferase involved in cell wall biosynthesis
MKILLVSETSGPGGAETMMLNLSAALRARGAECVVAVPAEGWVSQAARARSLQVVQYTPSRRSTSWEAIGGLISLAAKLRVDLVHAHMFDASAYAAVAASLVRVPMIATLHGAVDLKGGKFAKRIKCTLLRRKAHSVVLVSEHLRSEICAAFPEMGAVCRVVPNGIQVLEGPPVARNASRSTFVFGALGNIRAPKGYRLLLDAFSRIAALQPCATLRIAGEPDKAGLYEGLLARRAELGLDNRVEFCGHVRDVEAFLTEIDCLVSSSISEGMPLSLMEGMAVGLPVVATRCGGIPELIVHGSTGLLCEPGDVDGLTSAMGRVAGDLALRMDLGKAARAHAKECFSLNRMCDAYEKLYFDACRRPQADRWRT